MNTKRNRAGLERFGAVALATVLVLGACGGDADETAGADPTAEQTTSAEGQSGEVSTDVPDLCELLTTDAFEAVTGEKADTPEAQEPMGGIRGSCTISAETGFPFVMIAAYNERDREATLSMVDSEPVDGLGAEADWDDTAGLLIALDGRDWYLQVVSTGEGGGYDRDRSVEIARIVLDRL